MSTPPIRKDLQGLLQDHQERINLVERRLGKGSGSSVPYDANAGMVMPFAGGTVPDGWLLCDGAAISRSGFPNLFDTIGTTYGAGDGSTTFNLPNYKGRVLVGQDPAQTEFDALGEKGGAKSVALTANQLAMHSHTFFADDFASNAGYVKRSAVAYDATSTNAGAGGNFSTTEMHAGSNTASPALAGGEAHNNLQPYAVAQYIISTGEGVGGGSVTASGGSGTIVAGLISPFAGPVIPGGWLLCDGRAVARSGYPSLFAIIGVSYGAGDGSTTFNLPNLKGKVAFGQDAAQGEFDVLGESGGSKAHRHDFKYGTLDRNWTASGPSAGMNGTADSVPDDNDRLGAYRYSTGKFQGAVGANLSGNLLSYNASLGLSNANAQLGRFITTGDTDVPAGSSGLPPYVVTNYIISTGSGSGGGGTDVPVQLWGELGMTNVGGVKPLNGGMLVWDRVVAGTLGLTVSADMKTVTFVYPGSYRIVQHIGISTNPAGPANMNAVVDGVTYRPSLTYGTAGPAGAYNVEGEFVVNAIAGTTLSFAANAPGGVYDWSFVRIEKMEPIFVNEATAICGRGTMAANTTTPATAGTTFTINWSAYDGGAGVWSAANPSRFVLNKPGRWRVSGKIRMTGATSGFGYMNIWKNGNTITQNEDLRAISAGGVYPQTMDIISSNGSDYVEFKATNSNASQNVESSNCLVTLEWIGA